MANESIIAIPADVSNPLVVKRLFTLVVEQLDVILGLRGDEGSTEQLTIRISEIESTLEELEERLEEYITTNNSITDELLARIIDLENA